MTSTATELPATEFPATELPVDDATVAVDAASVPDDEHVLAELLVEEISIDGMCGVY